MIAASPEVLADPIAVVVRLVAEIDESLDKDVVWGVVESLAGGRAKRRRIAQYLKDNPAVLANGLSPAPRAVGDLLIALRAAGAQKVSAPRCAGCSKELRTLVRRSDDWYCGPCGGVRQPCAGCGVVRQVSALDRAGRPHCRSCPVDDGGDPLEIVIGVVAEVDPSVPAEVVAAAVHAATSRVWQRRRLAWALRERPELLTGTGAQAPVPSVLRLIDELLAAGAVNVVRPACPGCGRVVTLIKSGEAARRCRNCLAKSRAVPCSRCGTVIEPATRDADGRPLCPRCLITDPANQEICTGCRRRRPVSVRLEDGPLCPACRPRTEATCSICDRFVGCEISKATGEPVCGACQRRWSACSGCGNVRRIRSGSVTDPLCATCTAAGQSLFRDCPSCGETGQLNSGPCARCGLDERLRRLLSDVDGAMRPELRALYENLKAAERPASVLSWLSRHDTSDLLGELGRGLRPLTHAALDEMAGGKPIEHLRSVLVATAALPRRDEQMVRLEGWVTGLIASRSDLDEQRLLRRYGLWHLLRRLRNRKNRTKATETTYTQATVVKTHLRAAVVILDWLSSSGLTLASARQGDFEDWLASDGASHRREAGHFIRWARSEKLTGLQLGAIRWGGPTRAIDTEARWEQARWLIGDDTVEPGVRVAGLLVLFYAQTASAISRLNLDNVEARDGEVRLRLGAEPIALPEPLAALVTDLVVSRRGHATLGDQGTSPWLFPGGQPGRPISASRMAERLRQIGIQAGPARSTALFQLGTELPAAILARMLGIHISVAVQWQRASNGDYAAYAAQYSRRPRSTSHA